MKDSWYFSKAVFFLALSLIAGSIGFALYGFLVAPKNTTYTWEKKDGINIVDVGNIIQEINPDYLKLANKIENLKESDTLVIKLHNYGGAVSTASLLTNAIKASKATVIADVVGTTYSSGTAIACAADIVNIRPNAFLMQHPIQEVSGFSVRPTQRLGLIAYSARIMGDCKAHGIYDDADIAAVVLGHEVYAWSEIKDGKKVFKSMISPMPGIPMPAKTNSIRTDKTGTVLGIPSFLTIGIQPFIAK